MVEILNTNIANTGIYYGQNKDNGEKTLENITLKSINRLAKVYKSIPVTYEHNSKEILGYADNLNVVHNMLMADLHLYLDEDLEKCINMYISPEFILDDNNSPVAMVYLSIVEEPAISDNLKILDDDYVINAKKKMPYRSQKVQIIQTLGSDACKKCKQISDKTRSKPITWQHANSILPIHPNCRCSIEKV